MADSLDSNYLEKTSNDKVNLPSLNFGFEMVVPNVRQRTAGAISPTKGLWNKWQGHVAKRENVEFHDSNFHAIRRMLAVDGYVKAAVAKYVNSIFLRGYNNFTLNKDIEKYMKLRLQMIIDAMPDHNHLDDFYQQIARDLVAYANVYIIKVRHIPGKLPKGLKQFKGVPILKFPKNDKKKQLIQQEPIAAYELIHPASMRIVRDKESGEVLYYEQWPMTAKSRPVQKKERRQWDPEQVIHIVMDREDGYPYGIPSLDALLDDVRIFRSMEDCASRLAYRYAFPFTQVKVGLPTPGFAASEEDIRFYRELVQNAPPDATIVTNEKVTVEVVGVQGEALDLKPYLEHFKQRLFSGLQVSDVAMGEGDTANRSTADALTVEMHDQIKHYQNIIARNITAEIYRELLLEADWDWYEDPEKYWCNLQFQEIEVEAQIKRETHILSLVQGNLITLTEGRERLGEQPFTDKQWKDSYLLKVLIPQDIASKTGTIDLDEHGNIMKEKHDMEMETGKVNIQGAKIDQQLAKKELAQPPEVTGDASHKTTTKTHAITTGGGKKTVKKTVAIKEPTGPRPSPKSTAKGTSFKIRPANQHGRRTGPKRKTESNDYIAPVEVDLTTKVEELHEVLADIYTDFSYQLINSIYEHITDPQSSRDLPAIIDFVYAMVAIRFNSLCEQYLKPAFYLGWDAFEMVENISVPQTNIVDAEVLAEYNKNTTYRFIKDISNQIERTVKAEDSAGEASIAVKNILEAHAYRLEFLANSELPQAFWSGYASAALEVHKELVIIPEVEESCDVCTNKSGVILRNSMSATVRLSNVPPFHPNCQCALAPVIDEEEEME